MSAAETPLDRIREGVGVGLARIAHGGLRVRRSVVEAQISASFPDRDPAWVRETAAACYRHFGVELAVLARAPERLRRILDASVADEETRAGFAALRASGRGAVVATGHLGNWELAGGYLARAGLSPAVVALRQGRLGDRRLGRLRRSLGIQIVYREAGPRPLVRALQEGRVVGLVADQHGWSGSAALPFLGRPAWTPLGPARLALAAEVPLYFGAVLREGAGYRVTLREIERSMGQGDPPPEALTRAWLAELEREIEARPEQYFWFHRRWKAVEAATRALAGDPDPFGSEPADRRPDPGDAIGVERAAAGDVG